MSQNRIRELEAEITKHKALYYQGQAIISDEAYDRLEDELRALDPENPVLALVGSPVDSTSLKVTHQKKMLSLEKTYDPEEIIKFLESGNLVSVYKIDGSSCSLLYEDGHLTIAKTRGDGSQGENITMKAAYINDIPKKLNVRQTLEVRGEIFCKANAFHKIAEEMVALKLERPVSQRNIVAGLLGRKENITLARHLSFQAFDLIGLNVGSEEEKLKKLKLMGFEVPAWIKHTNRESIHKRIVETKEFMVDGDYLIDGLVFVLDETRLHEELGETSHHPRYKKAFKFQGETKIAKINSITWQVSRNGVLTPVAEIEPTELSGATINRVTLHNMGVVADFELKPNDEIEIVRSGEVIPKFLSVSKRTKGEAHIPKECPGCGGTLSVDDIWLLCANPDCADKKLEEILHWINQCNIEDLSEKRLREMIKKKLVSVIPDLYRLKEEDLLGLEKVKDKLAKKLIENIAKTKKLDLVIFLSAIGIEGISTTKAEKIVSHGYNTIEKILAITKENLISIDGFAEKSAADITASIKSKKKLIHDLLSAGITITEPESVEGGVLDGAKFCITGTLSMPRSEFEKKIKKNGGVVVGSVSKNTDYLLTNDTDPASSKYKKALEVGTKVINEDAFRQLIGE